MSQNPKEQTISFEVKVEKPLLEKILSTNKNLKKILATDKIAHELDKIRKENKRLLEQNMDLNAELADYKMMEREEQERRKSEAIEFSESRLLTMRLTKLEKDKKSLADELTETAKHSAKLQKENSELKKNTGNISAFKIEMRHLKLAQMKLKAANQELERDKLALQLTLRDLYDKYKQLDVEKKESQLSLLKMKLKTIQDEKNELLCDLERKRLMVQEMCEKKRKKRQPGC